MHTFQKKKINKIYNDGAVILDSTTDRNFMRNKHMVDLSMVPDSIKDEVLNKYDNMTYSLN